MSVSADTDLRPDPATVQVRFWHRAVKTLNMTCRCVAVFAFFPAAWCLLVGALTIPGLLLVAAYIGIVLVPSAALAVGLELLDRRLDARYGFEHRTLRDV